MLWSAQPNIKELLVLKWWDWANEVPGRSKLRKHVAQLPLLGSALCVLMVSRVVLHCMVIMCNIYEVTLKDFIFPLHQWLRLTYLHDITIVCACACVCVLFWSSTSVLGHLNPAVCQAGVGRVWRVTPFAQKGPNIISSALKMFRIELFQSHTLHV